MKKNLLIEVKKLSAWFKGAQALSDINLSIERNKVVAVIGPSGCGKSTFIRCLNRLHEEVEGAYLTGEVILEGKNIYSATSDPVLIRRNIGMVFQKPNPFPGMSIYDNVAIGLKLGGIRNRSLLDERVEQSLKNAALWKEVKDHLNRPGLSLSGGQQQRLCIARALAVKPSVMLMDEPTSALDPISTGWIEELLQKLKNQVTVIFVTHNMQQAARVSNRIAFFLNGELVEFNKTSWFFTKPKHSKSEDYITGRF
ncbi:MAG: phosphate ABC transporter ATP-binding protein PstB [Bdellovibrionaceae bacterium]|nr:phosphate ABC transporter ATP-binding protein PstB [Pseudobdellovibrionaceae bacterium]